MRDDLSNDVPNDVSNDDCPFPAPELVSFGHGARVDIVSPEGGFHPVEQLPIDDFFELLSAHKVGEKTGTYLCRPMGGDGHRADANALPWSVFAIDLDKLTPESFGAVKQWCEAANLDCQLVTTWSHTPEQPRARLWVRCSRPFDAVEHAFLHRAFTNPEVFPFAADPALAKPSQPIYLPRYPEAQRQHAFARRYPGKAADVDSILKAVQQEIESERRGTAKKAIPTGVRAVGGVAATFNAHTDLKELLEQHGYTAKGGRYLAPGSKSGNAAVVVYEGAFALSHHDPAHDALASLTASGKRRVHDAFSAFIALAHNGDFKAGYTAAQASLQERGLGGEGGDEDDDARCARANAAGGLHWARWRLLRLRVRTRRREV